MRIEWDSIKASANLRKHGVTFEEAATVFRDPISATAPDLDHAEIEERFLTFGMSARMRLLVVAHTEEVDLVRIISARMANRKERSLYEEDQG
jgi:uncharacterized DUF497 family protein